jgi:putative thiazole-containing bacteriocin maturation protein
MSIPEESVLAIGSGPILLSLTESWIDSGLSHFSMIVTRSQSTDTIKLTKRWEHALRCKPDASPNIQVAGVDVDWRTVVRQYAMILYVSQNGDLMELRKIQLACLAEKKQMLPAVIISGMGMIGPLLLPDGSGRWDSAWRRIHSTVFSKGQPEFISTIAVSVLSDILVNEGRKAVREVEELECRDQCYLLNPVTLTGSWHPIHAHPLVSGYAAIHTVNNIELTLETNNELADPHGWFARFTELTSAVSGIFHRWEEADLIQLPLAQCLVQTVDPLSTGPARLLSVIVRSGLTHEEARRESGLAGLEAYAARLMPDLLSGLHSFPHERIRIGAGCTPAEAVERGLRAYLAYEWDKRSLSSGQPVTRLRCTQIEDVRCRYYLQAVSIMDGEPLIAAGEPLFGFPVVWVYSDSSWYGSVDISFTLALRQSLQKALEKKDRNTSFVAVLDGHEPRDVTIPNDSTACASFVLSAIQTLKQNNKHLKVFDMRSESCLDKEPFILYGVLVEEEVSP